MATVFRRRFFVHVSRGPSGDLKRHFVSEREAARLRAAGERVEERQGKRWYVKYRDAAGGWRSKRSTARTKSEAQRLADDLERKSERQRQGLEPLPGDERMTLGDLCDW